MPQTEYTDRGRIVIPIILERCGWMWKWGGVRRRSDLRVTKNAPLASTTTFTEKGKFQFHWAAALLDHTDNSVCIVAPMLVCLENLAGKNRAALGATRVYYRQSESFWKVNKFSKVLLIWFDAFLISATNLCETYINGIILKLTKLYIESEKKWKLTKHAYYFLYL